MLRSIQKQQPYLKWGINRQHKQKLISASKRRFQLLFSRAIGLLLIIGLLWLGTEYYLATPKGEIQQVRWELNRLSKQIDSNSAAAEVAVAFAKDGNVQRAGEIIGNQIDSSYYKAQALSAIARGIGELNQPQEGIKLLRDALTTAQGIDSSRYKAQALIAIAETQAKFANWGDARRASEKITIQDEKAKSLAQVLTIWAEKQHPELARMHESNK